MYVVWCGAHACVYVSCAYLQSTAIIILRREEYVGKTVMVMEVPGKRRRGRPKRRWLDNIKNDLSERELSGEQAQYRVKWRCLIRNIDPIQKWERMWKKKAVKT